MQKGQRSKVDSPRDHPYHNRENTEAPFLKQLVYIAPKISWVLVSGCWSRSGMEDVSKFYCCPVYSKLGKNSGRCLPNFFTVFLGLVKQATIPDLGDMNCSIGWLGLLI